MGTLCAAHVLTFVLATLLERTLPMMIWDSIQSYQTVLNVSLQENWANWCAPYRLCGPGLCCLKFRNGSKICQPEAKLGEACSDAPIKGQIYPKYNRPCLTGMCVAKTR
uniref:Putative secreted protein n=1 Tax=Ixodes ricinus TaxID=34613 RepID=A0A090X822_IXORI